MHWTASDLVYLRKIRYLFKLELIASFHSFAEPEFTSFKTTSGIDLAIHSTSSRIIVSTDDLVCAFELKAPHSYWLYNFLCKVTTSYLPLIVSTPAEYVIQVGLNYQVRCSTGNVDNYISGTELWEQYELHIVKAELLNLLELLLSFADLWELRLYLVASKLPIRVVTYNNHFVGRCQYYRIC